MSRLAGVAALAVVAATVVAVPHPVDAVTCPTYKDQYTNPDTFWGYCTSVNYQVQGLCMNTSGQTIVRSGPIRNQPAMSSASCTSAYPINTARWMNP